MFEGPVRTIRGVKSCPCVVMVGRIEELGDGEVIRGRVVVALDVDSAHRLRNHGCVRPDLLEDWQERHVQVRVDQVLNGRAYLAAGGVLRCFGKFRLIKAISLRTPRWRRDLSNRFRRIGGDI